MRHILFPFTHFNKSSDGKFYIMYDTYVNILILNKSCLFNPTMLIIPQDNWLCLVEGGTLVQSCCLPFVLEWIYCQLLFEMSFLLKDNIWKLGHLIPLWFFCVVSGENCSSLKYVYFKLLWKKAKWILFNVTKNIHIKF